MDSSEMNIRHLTRQTQLFSARTSCPQTHTQAFEFFPALGEKSAAGRPASGIPPAAGRCVSVENKLYTPRTKIKCKTGFVRVTTNQLIKDAQSGD